MQPTIIKAHSAADFLAVMPHLVGFTPRNSIVFVPFRGKRTAGAMRFDLPASSNVVVQKRVATMAIGLLCKMPGIDSVVTVICTDEKFGEQPGIPRAELAQLLNRRIQQSGFRLRDALCVAADGWANYLDPQTPVGGHPLSEITGSDAQLAVPADLRATAPLPARVPNADPVTMRRVRDELVKYRMLFDELEALKDSDETPGELEPAEDLVLFFEGALDWDDDAISRLGPLLLFMVQGPPVRDLAIMQWASDIATGDRLYEETRRYAGDPLSVDPSLADILMGTAERPDPERLIRAIDLMLKIVAMAQDEARPAPLTMLGWLHWALGGSSKAAVYIAEARAIDPKYGMAELIGTLLQNGVLPEWAFSRSLRKSGKLLR